MLSRFYRNKSKNVLRIRRETFDLIGNIHQILRVYVCVALLTSPSFALKETDAGVVGHNGEVAGWVFSSVIGTVAGRCCVFSDIVVVSRMVQRWPDGIAAKWWQVKGTF